MIMEGQQGHGAALGGRVRTAPLCALSRQVVECLVIHVALGRRTGNGFAESLQA